MAVNFDALPTTSGGASKPDGRYPGAIIKTAIGFSKANNKQLTVTIKLDSGGSVNEFYQESDNDFMLFKLYRLLQATNVNLQGTGTIEDIEKLIRNKRVVAQVTTNDKGYLTLDYSKGNEGLYPPDVPSNPDVNPAVANAIGDGDDVDF